MFASQFRLRKKEDVDLIFKKGRSVSSPELAFRFLPNSRGHSRIAVLVGTKLAKKAADRNRIRRRLREIARTNFNQIPKGFDLLVVARDLKLRDIDFAELTRKFLALVIKIT